MMNLKSFVAAATVAAGACLAPAAPAPADHAVQPKRTCGGTASCKVKCKDGTCKADYCTGSGYLSIESAKSDLKARLEAKVRAEGNTIEGEVNVSVEWRF